MRIERLLQINMAVLASLATLEVGIGLRNPAMPIAMMLAALLSVWLTDIKGWFMIRSGWATVIRLAVLTWCLVTILKSWPALDRFVLIRDVATLLIVLQAIVLFHRKDPRTYWHLAELTLLQVVVAGLLTQGAVFGLLLVVYLLVGLSAMALLFLHNERDRRRRVERESRVGKLQVLVTWIRDIVVGPGLQPQVHRAAAGDPPAQIQSRWPLAGQQPQLAGGEADQPPVSGELSGRLVRMVAASFVLAIIAFLAVPRFGNGAWRGAGASVRATVGFTDKVRLGSLGPVLQNPQEVLRIAFFNESDGRRYPVSGEVYLRGAVLTEYDDGQWRMSTRPRLWSGARSPSTHAVYSGPQVRQRIQVEPLDRTELFCVWPFIMPQSARAQLAIDPMTQRLTRVDAAPGVRFQYELLTTAFESGDQVPIVPNTEGRPDDMELADLRGTPRTKPLPMLHALALEWTKEWDNPASDPCRVAPVLERQLRDSGRFRYSLRGLPRDPALDPVEDFISLHPEGHCEYFATALAQMLRHLGIPARIVVGYKTDEWNDVGEYFTVRQLHAHTWVEAYLKPDQVPEYLKRGEVDPQHPGRGKVDPRWTDGAWMRLDPTPAGAEQPGVLRQITTSKYFDWADYLWSNYVMEMDRPRQRHAIYEPVVGAVKEISGNVGNARWWRGWFDWLWEELRLGRWGAAAWAAVILAALAAVLIYVGHRSRQLLGRWLRWGGRTGGPKRRSVRPRVAFYRRLEAILSRHGIVREPSQTQREFADAAGRRLLRATGDARLAALPAVVAEAYYRVRFGGEGLDSPQVQAVEQALAELDQFPIDRTRAACATLP